ncbi:MAG: peptidoglycan-binding protein [Clostridia bacterium]|nr:peptidoglycan-binding protein [Clostridia bacterium]
MKKAGRCGALTLAALLALHPGMPASAYKADTLRSGMRGDAVRQMQQALISLGYLGGTADGIFGTNTENAVKKFQRSASLKADGLAGTQTLEKLYQKAGTSSGSSSSTAAASASSSSSASSGAQAASASSGSSGSSSSLFGGNYATLRQGSTGSRVTVLQRQLISLGYLSGSADGKFGKLTAQAVKSFQRAAGLTADGLAGKKTLQALESKAGASSSSASAASKSAASQSASSGTASSGATASGPSGAAVKLLHWYNDIKPTLRAGNTLVIYEPSSGQTWNLRVYSSGRHCDAEPRTAEDTAAMLKAFGENTWSQKAVYVKLPSGVWTIGATHSMPHLSGSVSDNNFNGHLCVHFLRDMSEAQENDPKYGVSNQQTIRAFWKRLTGQDISN